jgi:hypothetical protein
MAKRWWPEAIYEVKPYGALTLGLLAALVAGTWAWAVERWDAPAMAGVAAGCAALAYGAAVLRMRVRYRARSRWRRDNRQ